MTDTVLVAVEENRERMEPVIESSAEIAAGVDARVVLIRVYDHEEFETIRKDSERPSVDPTELAERSPAVKLAADVYEAQSVDYEVVGETGDPADEIATYVRDHGIDHVFLGGRHRSAAGKALLGSVSHTVLRNVDVPCTVYMTPTGSS